ncbi:WYL domain-containing protein [Flavobacteriaceae bacterium]|jgi:predicted DNA-binding transcriptional regulator YafY|nr:WYL domain-containing protein [Flavobacteriaceae bacterium]
MPQNKNFQKRITILDECFSSRTGQFTLDKLIETIASRLEISISRKTIQNDIKYVRETIENENSANLDFDEFPVFIPKLFEGKKTVFKYSNPDLALGNQLLSKTDQEQLGETLAILSRYNNRQDFFWLDELFPRIKSAFNLVHEDYNGLISYQSNRDYSGQSWVGKIYNQLIRKKIVIIEYKGFKDAEAYLRRIHPYHLKQYNNRWFLFGWEESKNYSGITNLALDRIINISETIEDIIPNEVNWADYFDEMIGVSRPINKDTVEVKLRFSVKRLPYVITKPIHGASQRLDRNDPEERTVILNLLPNYEMYQAILSFGDDVEIISPVEVRDTMKEITNKMNQLYN